MDPQVPKVIKLLLGVPGVVLVGWRSRGLHHCLFAAPVAIVVVASLDSGCWTLSLLLLSCISVWPIYA